MMARGLIARSGHGGAWPKALDVLRHGLGDVRGMAVEDQEHAALAPAPDVDAILTMDETGAIRLPNRAARRVFG